MVFSQSIVTVVFNSHISGNTAFSVIYRNTENCTETREFIHPLRVDVNNYLKK
jgi:subtilase family serine protease